MLAAAFWKLEWVGLAMQSGFQSLPKSLCHGQSASKIQLCMHTGSLMSYHFEAACERVLENGV